MAGTITDDTEAFIESVEKRPALYLKSLKEYSDINIKKKLWEEVCLEVVSGWLELEPEEKRKFGHAVQQKWLNLRTCFMRELKAQQTKSGQASKNRRVYKYFEKLLFLKSSLAQRSTDSNVDSTDTAEESEHTDSNFGDVPVRAPKAKCRKQSSNVNFEESLLNFLKEDLDEDKHFALSLVPSLASLTEDEKFEAKIEILKIFQRIKANRTQYRSPMSSAFSNNFQQPTSFAAGYSGIRPQFSPHQRNLSAYNNNYKEITNPQHEAPHPPINSENSEDNMQSFLTNFTPSPASDVIDLI